MEVASKKIESLTSRQIEIAENRLLQNALTFAESAIKDGEQQRADSVLRALQHLTAKQWLGVAIVGNTARDEGETEAEFVDDHFDAFDDATLEDVERAARAVTVLREHALFPQV
jgi:hypothetical protein